MSEPTTASHGSALDAEQTDADVLSLLAQFRRQGMAERHPVRMRYLDALAARLPAQPAPVREVLLDRLKKGIAALTTDVAGEDGRADRTNAADTLDVVGARRESADAGRRPPLVPGLPSARRCPLTELNRYIRACSQPVGQGGMDDAASAALPADEARPPPMKSVHRFGETWAKVAAERQVDRALKRAPQNAGPLNSHMLVIRAFALMRELSPDYLRHFLGQVDSLLWLDQVNRQYTLPDGKAGRAPRSRK